ncbi:stage II sporulation protein B [Priestia megaterium]|nr:stage II sporulation protein B [Priestia megaterium]
MDKRNQRISIKINGEKKEIQHRPKQEQPKDEFNWILPEPAAFDEKVVSIEDVRNEKKKKEKPVIKRASLSSSPSIVKRVVTIVLLAIAIGVGFGMFSLKAMTSEQSAEPAVTQSTDSPAVIDNPNKEKVLPADEAKSEANDDKKSDIQTKLTVEPVDVFIVQAGVFSTKTAAEKESTKLEKNNMASVILRQNNQYALVVGAGTNEASAKQISSYYKEDGQDVYVKSYQIQGGNPLNKEDEKVMVTIQPFMANIIDQSIKTMGGKKASNLNEIKDELEKINKQTKNKDVKAIIDRLQKAVVSLESYNKNKTKKAAWSSHQQVLTCLQQYEKVVNE